jgi:hypothetical protein
MPQAAPSPPPPDPSLGSRHGGAAAPAPSTPVACAQPRHTPNTSYTVHTRPCRARHSISTLVAARRPGGWRPAAAGGNSVVIVWAPVLTIGYAEKACSLVGKLALMSIRATLRRRKVLACLGRPYRGGSRVVATLTRRAGRYFHKAYTGKVSDLFAMTTGVPARRTRGLLGTIAALLVAFFASRHCRPRTVPLALRRRR